MSTSADRPAAYCALCDEGWELYQADGGAWYHRDPEHNVGHVCIARHKPDAAEMRDRAPLILFRKLRAAWRRYWALAARAPMRRWP